MKLISALSMTLYNSGASVFAHVLMLTEDTFNTSFDVLLL